MVGGKGQMLHCTSEGFWVLAEGWQSQEGFNFIILFTCLF